MADEIAPGWRGEAEPKASILLTNEQFVGNFIPPDYLVDGLIQQRFLNAITAPTHTGKTAVALLLSYLVICGLPLGKRTVEKGRVLFFAGENPDDVRMRWIKLCEVMSTPDEAKKRMFWVDGRLDIEKIRSRIKLETAEAGPFKLIIIDSASAFFPGDDENNNTQQGNYARMLRSLIEIVGGPAIILLCHPVKNFSLDMLLPRGGGALLNELDSNFVLIPKSETPKISELYWHAKHRGVDFQPITFKMSVGTSDQIKDSKGRLIWTVYASVLTDSEIAAAENSVNKRRSELLAAMAKKPGPGPPSLQHSVSINRRACQSAEV
jgi:hypothetical protein